MYKIIIKFIFKSITHHPRIRIKSETDVDSKLININISFHRLSILLLLFCFGFCSLNGFDLLLTSYHWKNNFSSDPYL